jgi:transcriptional regulator NrdR family protein
MKIIRNEQTIIGYDVSKIENAIALAFNNSNTTCNNFEELLTNIKKEVSSLSESSNIIDIENIQSIVENNLMKYQYFDTARHYIASGECASGVCPIR